MFVYVYIYIYMYVYTYIYIYIYIDPCSPHSESVTDTTSLSVSSWVSASGGGMSAASPPSDTIKGSPGIVDASESEQHADILSSK